MRRFSRCCCADPVDPLTCGPASDCCTNSGEYAGEWECVLSGFGGTNCATDDCEDIDGTYILTSISDALSQSKCIQYSSCSMQYLDSDFFSSCDPSSLGQLEIIGEFSKKGGAGNCFLIVQINVGDSLFGGGDDMYIYEKEFTSGAIDCTDSGTSHTLNFVNHCGTRTVDRCTTYPSSITMTPV